MEERIRTYEGSGVLRYANGSAIECRFSAGQDHNGTVRLDCTVHSGSGFVPQWLAEFFGEGLRPSHFEGQTDAGAPVRVSGPLIATQAHVSMTEPSRAAYILTAEARLVVGDMLEAPSFGEWRFGIANFLFESPELTLNNSGGADRGILNLRLASNPVRIQHIEEYNEAKAYLQGRERSHVTAEACLSCALDFEAARAVIADTCNLLSIAHGTVINWIYCDQSDSEGHRVYSYHYPAVTRPYSGALPLIDPNAPGDLTAFLEGVFDTYREKREERELRRIATGYADNRSRGFLESRCLTMLSLIEFVVWRDAVLNGEATVMSDDLFSLRIPQLKQAAGMLLRLAFPQLTATQARDMTDHVRGWNHATLRRKLTRTAKRLGFFFDEHEIVPLLETRNAMVHRMVFRTDNPYREFRAVLSVLDRLLMGLLKYEGPYIDARTVKRTRAGSD